MKNSEIKSLSVEELKNKLIDEKDNLNKLKFSHSVTPIENPMKIKESRKLIAKIKTEINSKKINKK